MTERTPKFLLVRLGSLGDVIHAIPSAAALRARYPDAQIDWLVDPRYTSVLQLVDGLNDAIPVDPRKSVVALLRTIGRLRRAKYDAVVDLQGLLKSELYDYATALVMNFMDFIRVCYLVNQGG